MGRFVADRAQALQLLRQFRYGDCRGFVNIQLPHEPLPDVFVKRRVFAAWGFQKIAENDDSRSNLLQTHKGHFTLRGSVNSHSCRIWAAENPRIILKTALHDEKVTVQCGFSTYIAFVIPVF